MSEEIFDPDKGVIIMKNADVLDMCCGSKMFYFDRNSEKVMFCDKRELHTTLCDGRKLDIAPDMIADFRDLPFEDESFYHVVFDPPHLNSLGQNSWMALKYGVLDDNWKEDLRLGFSEAFRVLKPHGTLMFKWNETDISVSEILKLTDHKPLYGHRSGKRSNTHWIVFLKEGG